MAGVIPVLDTAYGLILTVTLRAIRSVVELFEDIPVSEVTRDTFVATPLLPGPTSQRLLISPTPAHVFSGKHTVMYAQAHATPLYRDPTIGFDSCITHIPYGDLVLVMEPHGRFCRVIWETYDGWVLKEHLADRAGHVYPEFTAGLENPVDHPNTARVRALIDDAFSLQYSEFPLQAGEYVLYRLMRRGLRIAWPETRPRTPGSWHTILRGLPGVHMSVLPKQGTIFEYVEEHDLGHVAYVEAVFPDGVITISETNYPHGGMYSERSLTKDTWRSMRPVFIEIT
jgi:hypothetical protein